MLGLLEEEEVCYGRKTCLEASTVQSVKRSVSPVQTRSTLFQS